MASRRNRSATTGSAASVDLSTLTATWRDSESVGGQPHLGHASLRDATLQAVSLGEERGGGGRGLVEEGMFAYGTR